MLALGHATSMCFAHTAQGEQQPSPARSHLELFPVLGCRRQLPYLRASRVQRLAALRQLLQRSRLLVQQLADGGLVGSHLLLHPAVSTAAGTPDLAWSKPHCTCAAA